MTKNHLHHPSLQYYSLIHFNGQSLYKREMRNIIKPHGPKIDGEWLVWENSNQKLHRNEHPAAIHKNGRCLWYRNGIHYNGEKPSIIDPQNKALTWKKDGKIHRIGGFANFNASQNQYELCIDGQNFFCEKEYIKACKDWLIHNESSHDCIEKFHELDEILKNNYLDPLKWEHGLFIG